MGTKRLILATRNPHKAREVRRILGPVGVPVRSLAELPPMPEVRETARTLEANALKKAAAVAQKFGQPAVSDDSGLFVPALGGVPGVRSARYAGPDKDYAANNRKLLRAMARLQGRDRRAYFATAVALTGPGVGTRVFVGKVWGRILPAPRGRNGFGYDPVFIPRGFTRTFAEMSLAEKNRLSHRSRAFLKLAAFLEQNSLAKSSRPR
jgi:non-canonical purine NTP pyrophosphatase (RdgB/HAM1 family)